jgi:type II secretory pathway component PulC
VSKRLSLLVIKSKIFVHYLFSKPTEQKQKVEKKTETISDKSPVSPTYEENFIQVSKSKPKRKSKEEAKLAEKVKPIIKKEENKVL